MVYYNNIPQSTDKPSQSQSQIASNFSDLDSVFGINHVNFTDATATNRGKHEYVTMIEQGADPGTAANEMALYTKVAGGATTLYLQREGGGTVIRMTPTQDPTIGNQGSTFLPGGVIVKWGFGNVTAAGTNLIFPSAFPNNCWIVVATCENAGSGINVNVTSKNVNGGTFRVSGAANATVEYIAIGN